MEPTCESDENYHDWLAWRWHEEPQRDRDEQQKPRRIKTTGIFPEEPF